MPSALAERRQDRLIRQLRAAHDALGTWEDSLRAESAPGTPGVEALISLLVEARVGIDQRLAELDRPSPPRPDSRAPFATGNGNKTARRRIEDASRRSVRLCMKACRACGRKLVRALREAQRAADTATTRVVYLSLRAFEKQLWLLDPLQTR